MCVFNSHSTQIYTPTQKCPLAFKSNTTEMYKINSCYLYSAIQNEEDYVARSTVLLRPYRSISEIKRSIHQIISSGNTLAGVKIRNSLLHKADRNYSIQKKKKSSAKSVSICEGIAKIKID